MNFTRSGTRTGFIYASNMFQTARTGNYISQGWHYTFMNKRTN